jgi:hypothetical protein
MASGPATARNPLVAIGETSIGHRAVTDAHEGSRRSQNHFVQLEESTIVSLAVAIEANS